MDDEWTSVFSCVKCALRKLGRSPLPGASHRRHELQRIALDRGLSISSVEKHMAKAVLLLSDGMAGWYP